MKQSVKALNIEAEDIILDIYFTETDNINLSTIYELL